MLVFAFGSIFGGISIAGSWLITARAIQGVGAAMMGPAATAIIMESFPKEERGRAIGISVGISSVFLSLGPFLGGVFTEYVTWRLIFWINVPIAILGILLTFFSVQRSQKVRESFDFNGFFLLTLALIGLTTGLMQGSRWGWTSPTVLILLFGAIICLVILKMSEGRAKDPFINFALFRDPLFMGSIIMLFTAQFVLTNSIFWSIFFQTSLGYSPIQAGGLAIISTLPIIILSPTAGHLADKRGPRVPILWGMGATFISLIVFVIYFQFPMFWVLVIALVLFGGGATYVLTPAGTCAISEVDPSQRGMAAGIYNTVRYAGGSMGIAILGTTMTDVQDFVFYRSYQKVGEAHTVPYQELWNYFSGLVLEIPSISQAALNSLRSAFVSASFDAFTMMSLLSAVIALASFFIGAHYIKSVRPTTSKNTHEELGDDV